MLKYFHFKNVVTIFMWLILIYAVNGAGRNLSTQKEDEKFADVESRSNSKPVIIQFNNHDLELSAFDNKNATYSILAKGKERNFTLNFNVTNKLVLNDIPSINVSLQNHSEDFTVIVKPISNGRSILFIRAIPSKMVDSSEAFIRVSAYYSTFLLYLSDVVGWTYFIAWSVSFYPQIVLNCKRKSVIGLHFDFLSLNVFGFLLYGIFNIGFYCIPSIQDQYFQRHPYGVNPVQLNDVVFSVHAFFACLILVLQCLIYETGNQKISSTGRSFIGSFAIGSIVMLILGAVSVIAWIDFLYFLSYVKLFITLVKYIPQAYYNYLRKSTSGWSIGNILLDFTGGLLSIIQMFILASNFDDWSSIFGDPTKFGLGLISIMFDIFFIIQHYVLYKDDQAFIPLPSSLDPENNLQSESGSASSYGTT